MAVCLGIGAVNAHSAARPFTIVRADPALDALIAPDAKLRKIASGFGFADGPVWVRGQSGAPGFLLVSSIIGNVVYKVTPGGKVSAYLETAGYSGTDFAHDGKLASFARLHLILIGPNCTGIDGQGRLIWCAGQDRAIKRLENDGTRTVLADKADGKRFNGPNDVAIAADGAIYFTDSDVGLRGGINGGLAQMPDSVWRWKDGEVSKVVSREQLGDEPNGIALSPDGKYLYLSAGTTAANPRVIRYPVRPDGSVGAGTLFTQGEGIGDGMKTDARGNLYSTGPLTGSVRITSPAGKLLGILRMPKPGDAEPARLVCASALAFGGDDAKTLYITACDDIYAVPLKSPGILEGPAR
ncbi:SMP-30/gluconolactonase/LRE family protein [Sphingomonas sp. MMS24-J13]|uniref:SMP-30/gluconolactonase/LRE family protein n=1 Tax=Sphingomonas sp. MMS24-J13 TaxID=3238686 RepID=UPI00384F74B3